MFDLAGDLVADHGRDPYPVRGYVRETAERAGLKIQASNLSIAKEIQHAGARFRE